jgi:hypothetical protein
MSKLKNTEVTTIARENTRGFLDINAKDKEVVVVFKKKNSRLRTMVIRTGVPGTKGGENKVERLDRSYMTVFDTQKQEHRTVNLATLTEITIDGNTLEVV